MSFSQLFTDVIDKAKSIPDLVVRVNPRPSNNYQKTASNVNQRFKTINIWNNQIDNEIKGSENIIIKCPALFIEFLPEEPKLIGGGVTQYMDAKMYFHLYSDQLNSPNTKGDLMDMNTEIYDLRDIIKSTFLGFHTYNSSAMMSRFDGLDYKHKTITSYIVGFNFCFNDLKGSIYDPESSRYLQSSSINASINVVPAHNWISGKLYTSYVNVVYFPITISNIFYEYSLCLITNSSETYMPSLWIQMLPWKSNHQYNIEDFIFINGLVFKCVINNSDETFNINNWDLITRM